MKSILIIAIALFSCAAPKITPLKGSYSNGNFEATVDKPKDQIWDNIIDFFSKKGLPISLIDRSSGLIVSNEVSLKWTRETKEGKPKSPTADIVVQTVYDPNSRTYINPYLITGQWNIRIKPLEDNKTLVYVNLVNPRYVSTYGGTATTFRQGSMQSLGNFERLIFENIK